jgi:hypothetical protein
VSGSVNSSERCLKVIDKFRRGYLWPLHTPTGPRRARVLIPPSEKRTARQAALAVRARPVTLKALVRSAHLPPVAVWAFLAQEANPPTGVEGLEWMLLTTIEVKHKDDAYGSRGQGLALFGAPRMQRLEWYAKRSGVDPPLSLESMPLGKSRSLYMTMLSEG